MRATVAPVLGEIRVHVAWLFVTATCITFAGACFFADNFRKVDALASGGASAGGAGGSGGPGGGGAAVTGLALGNEHSCAIRAGTLSCWGSNQYGQLGDKAKIAKLVPTNVAAAGKVALVSAGKGHTCARRDNGESLCWGYNIDGELGDGTTTEKDTPTLVSGMPLARIAAGGSHSCGVTTDGTVYCWGNNQFGQLGNGGVKGSLIPTAVAVPSTVVEVAVGESHSCARDTDGGVTCWGLNDQGQLGVSTGTETCSGLACSKNPVAVFNLVKAAEVALGDYHSCARTNDGKLFCWGANVFGQLGDGSYSDRKTPTLVDGLLVTKIAVGRIHTCAIRDDGAPYCWGDADGGKLGSIGDGKAKSKPQPVTAAGKFTNIAAGGNHTCALQEGNTLFCWGKNGNGEVGDGSTDTRKVPVKISW